MEYSSAPIAPFAKPKTEGAKSKCEVQLTIKNSGSWASCFRIVPELETKWPRAINSSSQYIGS